MNDLQKKFVIVGVPTFIVWLLLAIVNNAFYYFWTNPMFDSFIINAIYDAKANTQAQSLYTATWVNALTFTTWLGSLIAFFAFKD
ncbi:hypothetical protein N9C34_03920 [Candidatus Marinimicrobia bacterium]|nr:hypothetical protein [Candidatus Neomarinimicrobiota bacterium]